MKYLIVYAHPNPQSFNHAILETISGELRKKGKEFDVRDLYEIGFKPVLKLDDLAAIRKGTAVQDVQVEQDYIRAADFLIFIYPLWWAGIPAQFKGYKDRVFSGFFNSMAQLIDMGIFRSCDLELVGHKYFSSVPNVTDSDRREMLEELKNITRTQLI
jgi:NAD(P)H dehydrogenase (quinone)